MPRIIFHVDTDAIFGETIYAGVTTSQLAMIDFYTDSGTTIVAGFGANFATGKPGEVVPIPEPGTVVSLLSSAAGLLGFKRFRRRSTSGRGKRKV